MPRKRTIDNAGVVSAAARVLARRGADRTRLADVAAEIGLAPATLVQRFGSREALLQEVARFYAARLAGIFADAATGRGELGRLADALFTMHGPQDLSFLLSQDSTPGLGAAYSVELRKQIAFTLAAAVRNGELSHCDVALFARRIQLGYYGLASACLLEAVPLSSDDVDGLVGEVVAGYA